MVIDLRSDTVTQPTEPMREAMATAEVGDDVYGEDPTVNALEAATAARLGKDAGLFVASGTQSNLLALLSHCERGDEYIAGQEAHTYRFEAGGAAVLGGIQPQPLAFNSRGELDLDEVRGVIKPDDFHFAKTRLVCLENTQSGRPLSLEYLRDFASLRERSGLAGHLDGARLFNAAVAVGAEPHELAAPFDSVSVCFSKGLGAPVGSVLVGNDALIARARRWRKMVGGGMRQAGILAAAAQHALDNHVARLADDHANARRLGAGLEALGAKLTVPVETNMVLLDLMPERIRALVEHAACRDVRLSSARLVTHLDVSTEDVDCVLDALADFAWKE